MAQFVRDKQRRQWQICQDRPNGLPPMRVTYDGFDQDLEGAEQLVVLADPQGDLLAWAVDDAAGLEQLVEYYAFVCGGVRMVGLYTLAK
jgi:hypothetical protein